MIDVSRHFQPIDVIKRNIDGMAAVENEYSSPAFSG